jgi:type I restriction enzyme, S subunit
VIPQADFEQAVGRKVTRILQHLEKRRHVEVDDFVISMRSFQGGLERAWAVGCIRSSYVVLRPVAARDVRYYAYLFKSHDYIRALQSTASFIRDGQDLTFQNFCAVDLPFPPLEEQAAIGCFLDHVDRRIRRYIGAKQKLIKLLEEQKQAIIDFAVTRRRDPYVDANPSAAEPTGCVPRHWRVCRLKDVAKVQTGLTLGKAYAGIVTETFPYLRVANVQAGHLDLTTVKSIDIPRREATGVMLRADDVLMTEGGDIDKLGRGCVWNDEVPGCLHQNHVFAVRCRQSRLLPEFLVVLMASRHGRRYFEVTAKQTTNLASTNSATLRAFPVILPTLDEQRTILDQIQRDTSNASKALDRAHREVDLLREFRTRLIADVVTGKLDVREAAARLPEEVQDPEPLGDGEGDLEAADVEDDEGAPEEAEA